MLGLALAGSGIAIVLLASLVLASIRLAGRPEALLGDQRLVTSVPLAPAGAAGNLQQRPARGRQVLADVPDPLLIEQRDGLAVPRIGRGGQKPWRSYARPFDPADDRPRIAVVIVGFGLNPPVSDAMLGTIPAAAALAIDPYVGSPEEWAGRARRFGHETLAHLPVQRGDSPFADAGPKAWSVRAAGAANELRLLQLLAAVPGAVGVLAYSRGDRDVDPAPLPPQLREQVLGRGLLLTEALAPPPADRLALGFAAPVLHVDVIIDQEPDATLIDQALRRLEQAATEQMSAIGLASPLPLTLARLQAWEPTLAPRGFVLAPITATGAAAAIP